MYGAWELSFCPNKYKAEQTEKINSSSKICKRGEDTGQTAAPKIGDTKR